MKKKLSIAIAAMAASIAIPAAAQDQTEPVMLTQQGDEKRMFDLANIPKPNSASSIHSIVKVAESQTDEKKKYRIPRADPSVETERSAFDLLEVQRDGMSFNDSAGYESQNEGGLGFGISGVFGAGATEVDAAVMHKGRNRNVAAGQVLGALSPR